MSVRRALELEVTALTETAGGQARSAGGGGGGGANGCGVAGAAGGGGGGVGGASGARGLNRQGPGGEREGSLLPGDHHA